MSVKVRTWARSLLSPRGRLLPGIGARLHRFPRFVARVLAAARRAPAGGARAAIYRSVSEPLIRRFERPLEVPVVAGSRMIVDPTDLVGRIIALSGMWEPQVTGAFQAFLLPGDVCVDVGANIGYFTLLASKLVGPEGHVYALEPSTRIHAALRANLELNQVTNVTALRVAAGDVEGKAFLYEGPAGNRGATSLHQAKAVAGAEVASVGTQRLDSLVRDEHVGRLRLVKIDVEGYEFEVLRGLEGVYLRGAHPAVIVELSPGWSGGDALDHLLQFCDEHDLKPFQLAREQLLNGREGAPFQPLEIGTTNEEQREWLLAPAS